MVHGTEATGKSITVPAVLKTLAVPHAIVESRECITGRHLLERAAVYVRNSLLDAGIGNKLDTVDGRCESISSLNTQLQVILEGVDRFVLVFDGVDQQREAPPTLIAALARLGEIIPCLTIVLILTFSKPRLLHALGVPHIAFLPYTRAQTLEIVAQHISDIYLSEQLADRDPSYMETERFEDNAWLWSRFCGAVWDSLGKGAARDIVAFKNVCERLWTPFVTPIRRKEYGCRDFSRLMVRNRAIFQSEVALHDNLVAPATLVEADFDAERRKKTAKGSHELPYYAKFLLIAAYLASHNPTRQDQIFFMKMHDKKRKKKSGGKGRPAKHRTIQRKLLGPQPFPLERWLAIFHAIVPHDATTGSADLLTQISTLSALRLIVKASASANIMDSGAKWRANIGTEYITILAKSVRFDVQDYLAE